MKALCICVGAIAYVCLRLLVDELDVSKGFAFMLGAIWALILMVIGAIAGGLI